MGQEKIPLMEKRSDGLSWYTSTESFNSIMTGLIAHYNVELINIRNERQTEEYRLYCRKMVHELREANNDLSITDSLERMDFYIEKYGPLLKKINMAI